MMTTAETADNHAPAPDGPEVFEDEKLIRFHHCDPAGIIFYPQYFVLFNELIEDWFTHGLGISFTDQVVKHRVSTPIGEVACKFLVASKIGDVLRFRLVVERIGTSSIRIGIEVRLGEQLRVVATLTLVHASLDTLKSVPIPDALRGQLNRYLVCDAGDRANA